MASEILVVVQFEISAAADNSARFVDTFAMLKVGDVVCHGDPPVSYFITEIDARVKSVTITSTPIPRASVTDHNVQFSELTLLDDSQNAARIARKATEGKVIKRA